MRKLVSFAIAIAALLCVAAPAGADWQRVGEPMAVDYWGGFDIKRIDGVPYVAWSDPGSGHDVVRVARLSEDGKSWTPVGGLVNHDPARSAGGPSLAEGPGGVPWIAWAERDADGVTQIRAAHLDTDGSGWEEPDPRPYAMNLHVPFWSEEFHYERWISGAGEPDLVFLGNRPYVAYFKNGGSGEPSLEVVRLADGGHAWELLRPRRYDLGGADTYIARSHHSAVIGGLLNIAMAVNFGDESYDFRYEADGTMTAPAGEIDNVPWSQGFVQGLTSVGDVPYALWHDESHDETGTHAYVSRLGAEGWEPVGGGPISDHTIANGLRVIGGRVYAATMRQDSSDLSVSYVSDDGGSWIPAGQTLEGDGGFWDRARLSSAGDVPYLAHAVKTGSGLQLLVERLDGAPAAVGASDGEGSGPGTDPDAHFTPVLAPVGDGPCGPLSDGTRYGEEMYGTPQAETLRGHGGRDQIQAIAGDDCLSGGRGADVLHAGRGDDRLFGGPGTDRLYAADGNDELHGGDGGDELRSGDGRAEDVWCGSGDDLAVHDAADRLHGCERERLAG